MLAIFLQNGRAGKIKACFLYPCGGDKEKAFLTTAIRPLSFVIYTCQKGAAQKKGFHKGSHPLDLPLQASGSRSGQVGSWPEMRTCAEKKAPQQHMCEFLLIKHPYPVGKAQKK